MSETITHTAVLDDALRLAAHSDEICPAIKDVAERFVPFARLGSVTRGGDRHIPSILERLRAGWGARSADDRLEPRLAYALGWMCHRATDRQMKPIFRAIDADCPLKPTNCSIYHDAFLFRTLYASDSDGPFSTVTFESGMTSNAASRLIDMQALKELMRTLLQTTLVELHTLTPDGDDAWGWLDRLFGLYQGFPVAVERYAEAIGNPDPDMFRRFVQEIDFYLEDEPIISAARHIQRGGRIAAHEVAEAAHTEPISHYAQALSRSFGYLNAASLFLNPEMSVDELKERLDVGILGRDGIPV